MEISRFMHRLIVDMHLQQQTPGLRLERSVKGARRSASISIRMKLLPTISILIIPNDQIAGNQIDFLPVIVNKWRSGVDTRFEPKMPCTEATFILLVEKARKYLLLDSLRISRGRLPSLRS